MIVRIVGDDPKRIPSDVIVAYDTETTGLSWFDDMLGVSLAWRGGERQEIKSCYLSMVRPNQQMDMFEQGGPRMPGSDARLLINGILTTNTTVGHSVSFDARVLFKSLGVQKISRPLDTMHICKSLCWNTSLALLSLYEKHVRKAPLWVKQMKDKRKTLHKLPLSQQARYARQDAIMTLELLEKVHDPYREAVGTEIYTENMQFLSLVCDLIFRGLPVNQDFIDSKIGEFRHRMVDLQNKFARKGVNNINSDRQVRSFVFQDLGLPVIEKTAGGKPSVKKEILTQLSKEHGHPDLKEIIAFRELDKCISSWLQPLKDMSTFDGNAHSILDAFGTVSYRVSSKDINLQGVPMKARGERAYGGLAGIFQHPDPEMEIWQVDLSQAEPRSAAVVSAENALADVLASGEDPYVGLAMRMWGEPRRQDAKSALLSSIYCIGAKSFSKVNGVTLHKAKQILDDFRTTFPAIAKATDYWEQFVIKQGYVPLPISGKRRKIYFDTWDTRTYKAFNQIVQATVAEYMVRAMLRIAQELPGRMVLQVHDSVVLLLHRSEREEVLSTTINILENIMPENLLERTTPRVPFLAEPECWDGVKRSYP